ncbi:MAG: hypothetical protein PHY71_04800 [Bacteroidaceae bacterium]|nr:hypothetical protein [Bacteroidaceae bacterium]
MDITLKNYLVKVKESITYGEKEDIEAIFIKSAKLNARGIADIDPMVAVEAKYKILEVYILEIKKTAEGGQEIVPFSKEWVRSLDIDDGDKLVDTINELHNSKKKD